MSGSARGRREPAFLPWQLQTWFMHSVQESVKSLQDELEGRFSHAMTMLSNSRDDMEAQLVKAVVGLTSNQINTDHGQEEVGRVEAAHPSLALDRRVTEEA